MQKVTQKVTRGMPGRCWKLLEQPGLMHCRRENLGMSWRKMMR